MKWRQTQKITIKVINMNSRVQRVTRVGTIVQRRTIRLIKANKPTRVSRVIPYVVDFVNTKDTSVQYIQSLTQTFVETEAAILLFYILMASYSLKFYKQPKSDDE